MKKYLLLMFIVVLAIQPLVVLGASNSVSSTQEDWTLAAIPELTIVSHSGTDFNVEINSINTPNTEMLIEKSVNDTFNTVSVVENWAAHTSGDIVTINLTDGETAYLRIKARNGEGEETNFSAPITLVQKPAMPTLSSQSSTDKTISLTVNSVDGATEYKIKRQDDSKIYTFSGWTFIDNTVLPARSYAYEFWAVNGLGDESDHNTVTIWTKPQVPTISLNRATHNNLDMEVGIGDNPSNIGIEVRRTGGNPVLAGTTITEENLQPLTDYTYEIRLKSENNEYTNWVSKTFTTLPEPVSKNTKTDEQKFLEKAVTIANNITYEADGVINSGSAWIDVKTSSTSYTVKATINGETKKLGTSFTRFDDLDDNRTYNMTVYITDGTYEYSKTYSVKTPNRTPPLVQKIYVDGNGNITIEVISQSGIKKE